MPAWLLVTLVLAGAAAACHRPAPGISTLGLGTMILPRRLPALRACPPPCWPPGSCWWSSSPYGHTGEEQGGPTVGDCLDPNPNGGTWGAPCWGRDQASSFTSQSVVPDRHLFGSEFQLIVWSALKSSSPTMGFVFATSAATCQGVD